MNKPLIYSALVVALALGAAYFYTESFPVVESNSAPCAVSLNPATAPSVSLEPEGVEETTPAQESEGFPYIEIVESCGPYFDGECVNLRTGPGTEFPVVMKLRNHMVLKVASTTERAGTTWYQIGYDTVVKFPERVESEWWVDADYTRLFYDLGPQSTAEKNATSTKNIVIKISELMLYAYENGEIFMNESVSTGLDVTPTPEGSFFVMRKVPDAYMQGPIPDFTDQFYDLPGVPWALYFTHGGAAIHGAYWHDNFGQKWSHGCVNLAPEAAEELYYWADVGTQVSVER